MTESKQFRSAAETFGADYEALANCIPVAHLSIRELDSLLGGVVPGRFTIIGGEPGAGKTSLCNQIKLDLAAQGMTVVYVTYETGTPQLLAKSIAHESEGAVKVGDVGFTGSEAEKLAISKYHAIAENIIHVSDPVTAAEIFGFVGELRTASQTPIALIVDYVQMIPPEQSRIAVDERIRITESVSVLRRCANKFGTAVFAISSISRGSYSKASTAGLDLLAGAQALEYNADSVILLSVEGKNEERTANLALPVRPVVARFAKNRFGVCGKCKLGFHTDYATFTARDEL